MKFYRTCGGFSRVVQGAGRRNGAKLMDDACTELKRLVGANSSGMQARLVVKGANDEDCFGVLQGARGSVAQTRIVGAELMKRAGAAARTSSECPPQEHSGSAPGQPMPTHFEGKSRLAKACVRSLRAEPLRLRPPPGRAWSEKQW